MRKIILAVLAVALIAAPAFASVQNVKVSGSVDSKYLYREGFDLGSQTVPVSYIQSLFLTITQLRVDADLTDNVSATVALINERAWGEESYDTQADNLGSEININLAYVTLREMLYSPLTVVIGRQAFSYGNSFIMDTAGQNNNAQTDSGLDLIAEDLTKQNAMDAIRLILDYDPLKIEAFWAKLDSNLVTGQIPSATTADEIDLYGVNATYEFGDEMNSIVETYLFSKKDQTMKDGTSGSKTDHVKVIGARGSITPTILGISGLNLQAEIAHQGGTYSVGTVVNQTRNAWGAQFITNYQVPLLKEYKPVVQYEFTKVTGISENWGNTEGQNDEYNAWDPMFENQAGGKIYNALFDMSDAIVNTLSLSAVPIEDLLAKVSYTKLWTEEEYNLAGTLTLNSVDGNTYTPNVNQNKRALGQEWDLDLLYNYTEDVQLTYNMGFFFPGDLFEDPEIALQYIVGVDVAF